MATVLWPIGKGMFVYDTGRLHQGDTAWLAQAAKSLELEWVSFKVADGVNTYEAPAVALAAKALQAAGVQTWGWHYVYGRAPQQEATVSAERVATLGLRGLMIDAEGEYDQV